MAKECASKLKIKDWKVVVLPPEELTTGLLEAIAASNERSSPQQCRKIAWELSGVHHPSNDVKRHVARLIGCQRLEFVEFE